MEMAWSTAWPYGPETAPTVVLRHDNGTQCTSEHYCEVAGRLGIRLSRTRYRHPDGNALVERIFLSLKQEEVWPQDYASFGGAPASVSSWIHARLTTIIAPTVSVLMWNTDRHALI